MGQIKLRHESQQHSRSSSCPPASSQKRLQKDFAERVKRCGTRSSLKVHQRMIQLTRLPIRVIRIWISRKYPWKPKEKFLLPWPPHPAPALLLQTCSRGS